MGMIAWTVHLPRKDLSLSILPDSSINIRSFLAQLLPAQPCVLCGSMSRHGVWCAACDAGLPYLVANHCPVCALPTPTGEVCGHCLADPPLYNTTTALYAYSYPLDRLIQAMKYAEHLALAHALAKKLAQRIDTRSLPDYVIPMPLHPDKLRQRGFNQALLIATSIARELHLKLLGNACLRLRNTPSQSTLSWQQREQNVRNAFRCEVDLTGKRVALVDDVLTSGATLNACTQALQKRGASMINVWVVARTLPHTA